MCSNPLSAAESKTVVNVFSCFTDDKECDTEIYNLLTSMTYRHHRSSLTLGMFGPEILFTSLKAHRCSYSSFLVSTRSPLCCFVSETPLTFPDRKDEAASCYSYTLEFLDRACLKQSKAMKALKAAGSSIWDFCDRQVFIIKSLI